MSDLVHHICTALKPQAERLNEWDWATLFGGGESTGHRGIGKAGDRRVGKAGDGPKRG